MADDHEYIMELVWENGQILRRGLCTGPSYISSHSHPSQIDQVENDKEIYGSKRARLGTVDSSFGEYPSIVEKELAKRGRSLQHENHPELFPGFYGSNFNMFLENTTGNDIFDNHTTESHVVPVYKKTDAQPGDALEFAAQVPQLTTYNNSQLHQSCLEQWQAYTRSRNPVESAGPMDLASGSKVVKDVQNQQDQVGSKVVPTRPISKPPEDQTLPDEQSEAVFRNGSATSNSCRDQVPGPASSSSAKIMKSSKPDTGKSIDPTAATTSTCSRGASNDPTSFCRYEDTEGKENPSDKQAAARGSAAGSKRKLAEIHNHSERRRRAKINKKMRALKDLIPNSNKVDKASVLDEAIDYLKSLQLQLQLLSMGTRLCLPPMIPTGMMQNMIHAPQLAPFSSMGMGMGMHMGLGCSPAPFPASTILGLTGQMLPMPMPQTPYVPLFGGNNSTQSVPIPGMSGVANIPLEFLKYAPFFNSKDAAQNISSSQMMMSSGNIHHGSKIQSSSQAMEKGPN